jgi:hypothetical protein
MSYVVIVCGSRNWRDLRTIFRRLNKLPGDTVIYHGDNGYDKNGVPLWGKPDWMAERGADKLAGRAAAHLGLRVVPVTPEWKRYGKRAGPLRNKRMLEEAKPNLVIAFHDDIEASAGTKDMVSIARAAGVEVEVIATEMTPLKQWHQEQLLES